MHAAEVANGPTHSMKEGTRGSFSFIEPMKALAVQKLPEGDWLYEIKHDGYRALGFKDGREVRLVSRNKKTLDYPQLLEALKSLPADRAIPRWRNCRASTRKAALHSSVFSYSKSLEAYHWSITSSICSFWMGKDVRQEPQNNSS